MLRIGDRAPDISLPDADMEVRALSELGGRLVVLYFYPRDDTPGCTIQANEFSDLQEEFESAGATVVGVSPDDCFSHQAFRDKYGLSVMLLADVEGEAAMAYGVLQEREKDGVRRTGVVRSTFLIDRDGVIRHAEYGVSPKEHARRMLELVRRQGGADLQTSPR
jgi:peroxiredoxin Q/BCP